ncbi:Broad substrate specificity ATP-binding cassette transporter ABCG2 [Erysiphe necator]|nr:Broad substrate specificity ATP-binding cassette transporter ABCG2 [Erysiphe necator]
MESSNSTCLSNGQPIILNNDGSCNPGFFCPNNDEENPPTFCPPTAECYEHRLQNVDNICLEPQGLYEPVICAPGYYCSLGGKSVTECPKDHFCPLGSFEPIPCGRYSICPKGAKKELVMDGFIVAITIDLFIIVLLCKPLLASIQKSWGFISQVVRSLMMRLEVISEKSRFDTEEAREPQLSFTADEYTNNKDSVSLFVASIKNFVGMNDVGISIGFRDISYTLESGKTIVAPQTGHIEKGSIWAVMGASGAGKTSFFNLIMGKLSHTGGEIYANRAPCNISKFKRLIGFVPQDDILMAELTVRENIMHNARVRLASTWTDDELKAHVDLLISCLGLSHVQNNIVGDYVKSNISGGQRKRVSIGMELVAAPMAVFLDEPTSGLDSTAALSIVNLLKMLSQLGMTIICVIHQPRPEILEMLDGIHLLGRGRQLYHGDANFVASYFESLGFNMSKQLNLADAILDIISDNSTILDKTGQRVNVSDMADRWASRTPISDEYFLEKGHPDSQAELKILIHAVDTRGASWLSQVRFCLTRSLRQQWRQMTSFSLEIAVGAIAGLLIGLSLFPLQNIYFQGIYLPPFQLLSSAVNYTLVPQIGLFCCLSISLASAAPGVKTFGEEKQVYWREASTGSSRSAYYAGKTLSTLPRILISALHYTVFFNLLAAPFMSFWRLYLCNLMYFYCIYGLASIMSMIVRREDGPLMSMLVSLIVSVFSGYGPPLSSVKQWHLEWFWRLCPGIWYTEAFYDQFLKPLVYLYDIKAAEISTSIVRERFVVDVLFMYAIGSIYRVIAFFGLIFMDRDKQR